MLFDSAYRFVYQSNQRRFETDALYDVERAAVLTLGAFILDEIDAARGASALCLWRTGAVRPCWGREERARVEQVIGLFNERLRLLAGLDLCGEGLDKIRSKIVPGRVECLLALKHRFF